MTRKNILSSKVEEIKKRYLGKTSIKKLSKEYGCNVKTMASFLKDNGIVPTKKGYPNVSRFTKEKEDEIIHLYKLGKTQKEIAKQFNTFNTSIRRVLLRYNIIPRSNSKVNRLCKHNPFKKNDEYSEYFLGLLLTDGCISKELNVNREYTITLGLTSSDEYIIIEFRDWISPKTKISRIYQKLNGSYMSSVSISNCEVIEWLRRKGNFYNKSFECKIYCPITWNILRGIFDGDGGFRDANIDGLNWFVCGMSKVFLMQIYQFLVKQGIKAFFKYAEPDKYHTNGLYYVYVYNYEDVIKIGLNMYSSSHIFLLRKYEKWLTFYENKRDKYTLNSGNEWSSNPEQNLPTQEVISKLGRDVQRL